MSTEAMKPIFYRLPADLLEDGMSTDDGQDILEVVRSPEDGTIFYLVFTPRSDDPAQHESNQTDAEWRITKSGAIVDLARFSDTGTDGSHLPEAVVLDWGDFPPTADDSLDAAA
ncbi:hypothetical protein D5S17_09290 [Pseudonocardiaceae bacterium YIM PH 21723]|nr:hypothetical protein D5S17_09290 [Pseudonocardiaceae bacterium YIM PH 21723]